MKKDDKNPEVKEELKNENPNTKLWDSVYDTDPAHTKAFQRSGGFSGLAIKPLSLIHRATQLWGSMGDRWGAEEVEREVLGELIFIKVRVWYPGSNYNKASVEHWGGDSLVIHTKSGDRQNDEAFKMAFTDAVGKCLVQLGFSADVHMGEFDDKYARPEQKPAEAVFASDEARSLWLQGVNKGFTDAKDIAGCERVKETHRAMIEQLKASKHILDATTLAEIKQAYSKRVLEFEAKMPKPVDVKDDGIPY